ncbi:group II intron reverse transcriptase/maturase [Reticulibacter mediterranei]|uniref:Group II intron reverse transcriptase/maturase n=1 Tax=Reticulibacter mediterranei TaxID=2778369 RepID=A0A8J3J1J0_9CHLR|nr:group II intron reverse transcriptase/maturase [Reticulibacter mediterranei]GHP00648.1 group II intron reverse transcriptase/maturase [Reticulibacter mediterranei]
MADRKAPQRELPADPASETWNHLPWRKLEKHTFRLQKRIFRASQRGNTRAVHKLQKLLMKSEAARLIAVRRVTQDNRGKKTAGVDGIKSVSPKQRLVMAQRIHPKQWVKTSSKPVRRIYIPKPGKDEKRPLGIPTIFERGRQALAKLAMEPQWEARFEAHSYGFRPGRSCHDAIQAIFDAIKHKAKYILDADIAGCFDHISHPALLQKLDTYPTMKQAIKGWLKAGVLTEGRYTSTEQGTPQGGVISPLLMNIALHGMETALLQAYKVKERPQVVRYADDFAIFHPTEEGVKKAQTVVESWLREIGLELKPSKTRISHTLTPYQGNIGMDFLGFTIRQSPVGKNRTGTNGHGQPLGFKTLITPSKEAIQGQIRKLGAICKKCQGVSQERLIRQLNPVIRGWSNYYRAVVSKMVFSHCDHAVYEMTRAWARRRHPYKNGFWIKDRYWKTDETHKWIFRDQEGPRLRNHSDTVIRRHVKVKGNASPYDGNFWYWSQRLKQHPMLYGKLARLLQKQQGKCRWCELTFRHGDRVEIDHITPKSEGGGDELSNLMAIHRHCHDQRHARKAQIGIHDKDARIEEPDEGITFTSGSEGGQEGVIHLA